MGTLDNRNAASPETSYLTRSPLKPLERRTTTAFLDRCRCARPLRVPTTTARISNVVMPPSFSPTRRLPRRSCLSLLLSTEGTGPSRGKDPSASAGGAVRSPGATRSEKEDRPPDACKDRSASSHPTCRLYFCWASPSRLRAQRKPVPCVCSAKPPRPRADAVMSANGLCQEPPRIDRTTPFLSGP